MPTRKRRRPGAEWTPVGRRLPSPDTSGGHPWRAKLRWAGGQGYERPPADKIQRGDDLIAFGNGDVPAGARQTGSNIVYGVPAGRYHFHVLSGCAWHVSIAPH